MRWRIVIGVVVLLIVVACLYWFGPPRKGNVEYHKRRYVAALTPSPVQSFVDEMPWGIQEAFRDREIRHIEFYRQALIDAGFLGQKIYSLSNRPPIEVANTLLKSMNMMNTNTDPAAFHLIRHVDEKTITIVGPPDQLNKWDQLIRDADVPKQ